MQDRLESFPCHMSMHQFPVGTRQHNGFECFVLMPEILDGLVVDLILIENRWAYWVQIPAMALNLIAHASQSCLEVMCSDQSRMLGVMEAARYQREVPKVLYPTCLVKRFGLWKAEEGSQLWQVRHYQPRRVFDWISTKEAPH